MNIIQTLTAMDAQLATITTGNVAHRSAQVRSQIMMMKAILNDFDIIVVPKYASQLKDDHVERIIFAVAYYFKMPFKSIVSTCRAAPLPEARILCARIMFDKWGESGVHAFAQYTGRSKPQARYYMEHLSRVDDIIKDFNSKKRDL